jgi:transketolase
MRDVFIRTLTDAAEADSSIVLLTADLGFGVLDNFSSQFPKQYLNVGIAEQNMASMSAGMALEGLKVWNYSIGNFPTLRSYEQLRNDVAYHDANVKVVSVGAGFSYGPLGMSHHATEDIAAMRAIPNFEIIVPGCKWETQEIVRALSMRRGPAYLRLDKSGPTDTSAIGEELIYGRVRKIQEGSDVVIVSTGGIIEEAMMAASLLLEKGVTTTIASAPFIRPFDEEGMLNLVRSHTVVATLEEHILEGGLGALIAETCMDHGTYPTHFLRFGLKSRFESTVGSQKFLRHKNGLDAAQIFRRILDCF